MHRTLWCIYSVLLRLGYQPPQNSAPFTILMALSSDFYFCSLCCNDENSLNVDLGGSHCRSKTNPSTKFQDRFTAVKEALCVSNHCPQNMHTITAWSQTAEYFPEHVHSICRSSANALYMLCTCSANALYMLCTCSAHALA
jgi:hypothetical protein